jgi:Glyoxalase-like domain
VFPGGGVSGTSHHDQRSFTKIKPARAATSRLQQADYLRKIGCQGRSLTDRTRAYCGGMNDEQAFPVIRQTVLDTTGPRRLAEFYRQLFGLRYRPGDEPPAPGQPDPRGQDWLVLKNPADGAALAFQKVEELPEATWPDGPVPQQLHLDTTVPTAADLDVQHERALALGARLLKDRSDDPEEPLRVYADPAGHPFCIFVG